jgi:hypothetical protein
LSDLGAEVEAFSAQLTDAIAHSEGAKSQAGLSSHELEAARIALCNACMRCSAGSSNVTRIIRIVWPAILILLRCTATGIAAWQRLRQHLRKAEMLG